MVCERPCSAVGPAAAEQQKAQGTRLVPAVRGTIRHREHGVDGRPGPLPEPTPSPPSPRPPAGLVLRTPGTSRSVGTDEDEDSGHTRAG